jgi:hypothetical protein
MMRQTSEMEEKLPALFKPHTVLPEQYFTRLQRSSSCRGEHRLMAAILEDAVAVCRKLEAPKRSEARHVLGETLRWLRSNDRTWTFSFLRICETLDLEPSAIRRGIRVLRGDEPPEPARISRVTRHLAAEVEAEEFLPLRRPAAGRPRSPR